TAGRSALQEPDRNRMTSEGPMKVRLLALAALTLAMACEGTRQPTGVTAPTDPSKIISDGAHGGANKDFFLLPPLLPSPASNANFDAGKSNNALRPSLQVQICELNSDNLSSLGLPTAATGCKTGDPIANFSPGSVQLVASPRTQIGWWMVFNLPADGFYYVLWDT